jgi:hypothetical protein
MKRYLSIGVIVFGLALSGCNLLFKIPVGGPELIPTETFLVNFAAPADEVVTAAILSMAPSDGSLLLSNNTDGLAEGGIQYNVAEWKPVVEIDGNTLRIEQKAPENSVSINPKGSINTWDLKLTDTLANITVSCPTGNYTLTFADTLPDGVIINVNAGVGNLRLEFPKGVHANVEVHRGPANITTEGTWRNEGKVYESGDSGAEWTVKVDIGVGNLTLASQ